MAKNRDKKEAENKATQKVEKVETNPTEESTKQIFEMSEDKAIFNKQPEKPKRKIIHAWGKNK